MLGEGGQVPAGLLRAEQPVGAVFALGWVMAELFDPRRRVSVTASLPAFDTGRQLPSAAELTADPKLVYLAAQLAEYLRWFPGLAAPLTLVTAQTNKKKQAVEAENLATAQGAEQADLRHTVAAAVVTARAPFSEVDLLASVAGLNKQRAGQGAGSGRVVTGRRGVLQALRVQGSVWRSVLIADPAVAVQPAMEAWVQAVSSIARAARLITEAFLRRFWPAAAIALVVLGALLALVISNLSGASQVWASLVTVAAVLGGLSWTLGNAVSSAFSGVGYEIWSAAKLDAAAWNITWLPALTGTAAQRTEMDRRGVAMPRLRKSLDVTPPR